MQVKFNIISLTLITLTTALVFALDDNADIKREEAPGAECQLAREACSDCTAITVIEPCGCHCQLGSSNKSKP